MPSTSHVYTYAVHIYVWCACSIFISCQAHHACIHMLQARHTCMRMLRIFITCRAQHTYAVHVHNCGQSLTSVHRLRVLVNAQWYAHKCLSTCTTDHRGEMRARETQLKNFFQNVEAALRGVGDRTNAVSRWEVSVCYIVCACVCVCVCV
jgi:hypothetical protein